ASSNITVLRDGQVAAKLKTSETSLVEIAELMIGRRSDAVMRGDKLDADGRPVALRVRNLSVDMPGEDVRDISLDVLEGEILGIGGLAGQGKIGIPNGIMGLYRAQGDVEFFGEPFPLGDPHKALAAGMAMVSEDRREVGLLLDQSIEDNIVFNAMQVKGEYLRGILGKGSPLPFRLRDSKAIRAVADSMVKSLDIRCTSPAQHAGTLSGGNQQKVCIARALVMNPRFLFVCEPTRGIDIGAKQLVLSTLVRMNKELGMTVVVVSSELNEMRSICDRIAIVSEGKLIGILPVDAPDAAYGLAMSGISPEKEGLANA
ncbi:MAG TPA: ATP-binding cassette domain-containing protein, partial [Candidatus Limnocylindria bacterium]|nr:ATP-binding cassette domain-containing protein [Candidatus Limnocylindria bacterium]